MLNATTYPGVLNGKVVFHVEGYEPLTYMLHNQTWLEGAMEVVAVLLKRPTEMDQHTGVSNPLVQFLIIMGARALLR